MSSLQEKLWEFILIRYSECGFNKTRLSEDLACELRSIRNWFHTAKKNQIPKVRAMLGTKLWLLERDIIIESYERNNRNKTKVAKEVKLTVRIIRKKIRQYQQLGFLD